MNNEENKIEKFFPAIEHGIKVLGNQVLIQGMTVPKKSGVIDLLESTRKEESYNISMGKVAGMGALAYKNKQTLEPWVEGNWADIGDVVSIPRSGYRITRTINDVSYSFILIADAEVLAKFDNLDGLKLFEL